MVSSTSPITERTYNLTQSANIDVDSVKSSDPQATQDPSPQPAKTETNAFFEPNLTDVPYDMKEEGILFTHSDEMSSNMDIGELARYHDETEPSRAKSHIMEQMDRFGFTQALQRNAINLLGSAVSYENLECILQRTVSETEKEKLIRSFITAGKVIHAYSSSKTMRYIQGNTAEYSIAYHNKDNKGDLVIITGDDPYERGSKKKVIKAVHLNSGVNFVKLSVDLRHSESAKSIEIFKLKSELNISKMLHNCINNDPDVQNRDCLMEPPLFSGILQTSNSEEYDMFQVEADGDGERLIQVSPKQQLHALINVAQGLSYMHEKGWGHTDVKPKNILFFGNPDSTKPIIAKVADFGSTLQMGEKLRSCTPLYVPHENLTNVDGGQPRIFGNALPSVDSFSLGKTILELLDQEQFYKFKYKCALELKQRLHDFETRISLLDPSIITPEDKILKLGMLNVARSLMHYDPAERISCAQAAIDLQTLLH